MGTLHIHIISSFFRWWRQRILQSCVFLHTQPTGGKLQAKAFFVLLNTNTSTCSPSSASCESLLSNGQHVINNILSTSSHKMDKKHHNVKILTQTSTQHPRTFVNIWLFLQPLSKLHRAYVWKTYHFTEKIWSTHVEPNWLLITVVYPVQLARDLKFRGNQSTTRCGTHASPSMKTRQLVL